MLPWALRNVFRDQTGRGKPPKPESPLANFGCGTTFHRAWDNFDFVPCGAEVRSVDLRQSLPFEDNVYDAVYSSHTLEHLPRNEAPAVLAEFRRILKPAGIIRIVVPDLELMARTYLEQLERASAGDEESQANHAWMSVEMIDQMTRTFRGGFMGRMWRSRPLPSRRFIEDRLGAEAAAFLAAVDAGDSKFGGTIAPEDVFQMSSPSAAEELAFRAKGEIHRWMYDRVSLRELLASAGFAEVRQCRAGESAIAGFSGYGLDTDENGRVRKPESLFMEGSRSS
jgi:predicted SAM-dependent methyltransferase